MRVPFCRQGKGVQAPVPRQGGFSVHRTAKLRRRVLQTRAHLSGGEESLGIPRQSLSEEVGKTQQLGRPTMRPLWDGWSACILAPRHNGHTVRLRSPFAKRGQGVPAQHHNSATLETGVNFANYIARLDVLRVILASMVRGRSWPSNVDCRDNSSVVH